MKVIGINGSPRKRWNTATLVQDALDGAAEAGAETELVNTSTTWTSGDAPAASPASASGWRSTAAP